MQAISALSEKVKQVMPDTQKWADQSKTVIHWLNSTIYNHTTIFTCIRQLEFAILQMQNEIQHFMMGIECIFLCKLPINLIPPTTAY
jgi:hypothetical protein